MSLTSSYQKLSPWLYSPLDRAGRAYLEKHLDLLNAESDAFLELFIAEHKDNQEEQNRLSLARHILRDASARGKTSQAVRESYINVFGGLILDPPAWLQEIEQQWTHLLAAPLTGRSATLCKLRLREALEQAQADPQAPSEMWAELSYLLGNLFVNDLLKRPVGTFQGIINYYTSALQVYVPERYPLRCAKILMTLGHACYHQAARQDPALYLQATHYYGQALGIYHACETV